MFSAGYQLTIPHAIVNAVNTGQLIKTLRAEERSAAAKRAAQLVADHFSLVR